MNTMQELFGKALSGLFDFGLWAVIITAIIPNLKKDTK